MQWKMTRSVLPAALLLALPGCTPPAGYASAGNAPGAYDGRYAGTATIDVNMHMACQGAVPVELRVEGGRAEGAAQAGAFRGTVRPDGSALLQWGESYMSGQFSGSGFRGTIQLYPSLLNYNWYCVYKADLPRVAG